ncbi:hypothetical protein ACFQLX_18510 [Streptomyces polyrhachis]|uniref:Uncharacterized protein n=1 Tax=Streptomyces polyrhachis TaxID=1282885 RepID=A0ABW2GM30_9ACTN
MPDVASLEELNEKIAAIDQVEDGSVIHGRLTSIGFDFVTEIDQLAPLPTDDFSRITVRQCYYSVPARFIGQRVRVVLRANELLAKPGALAGSTAPASAREQGTFTATHEAFWAAARAAHGQAAGTRALTEVLLLRRRMSAEAVHTAPVRTLGLKSPMSGQLTGI